MKGKTQPRLCLVCCHTEGPRVPMLVWNVVHKGVYHDSVMSMRLTRDLQVVDGVQRAAVMMGTPSNRALLRGAGLLTSDGEAASPNDLDHHH